MNVFGGYTTIPWGCKDGDQEGEGKSFLFSVRNDNSVVKLELEAGENVEVFHRKDCLCNFGGGSDIDVITECTKHSRNNTNLTRYKAPPRSGAHYLNGGKRNFKVNELEVFLVI